MSSQPPALPTSRTRLNRRPQRGAHDHARVAAILDAGVICQIGYLMDGEPRVLPTVYWPTGEAVYWHGSRESGALKAMAGAQVCFTLTLLDGLVLAKSAFHHSANYRSVMVFGRAEIIEDVVSQMAAYREMFDRLYPGRWPHIRGPSRAELAATMVLKLELTEVSAKARTHGPVDAKGDLRQPAWAGVIPLSLQPGEPRPAEDLRPGGEPVTVPDWLGR